MNTTIYYFSATGNSLDVARELAQKTGAKLKSLAPFSYREETAEDETVGIVFPVYDWNMPYVVRDFVRMLGVSKARYFFAVATCNYLPGRALISMKKELIAKGKTLNAGFVVNMPGTYLPMYGANPEKMQQIKFAAMRKKTDFIAKTVLAGKNRRMDKSPLLIDRLLASKMEKHMDNFPAKDREFVVEPGCNGCGTCASVCPFGNIVMEEKKPVWLHKCQQCLACIHLCAKECIQIGSKTKNRKRYKNPNVTLRDLIASAGEQ